jgi:uncharacterized membrane protein (GlpM family)
LNSSKISWNSLWYFSSRLYSEANLNDGSAITERKVRGHVLDKLIPMDDVFRYILYRIFEPEPVTESKGGHIIVLGNWVVCPYVVYWVSKWMFRRIS